MRKTYSSLSFQLWIGLAKQIIFLADSLRISSSIKTPLPGTRRTIASGSRQLQASFLQPFGGAQAAVLIFHGIGDRIEYWAGAQRHLAQQGIASLIFHYSGHAGSPGAHTPENLHEDARATHAWLRAELPDDTPIFLLGFSLGSGVAAHAAPSLHPPPAGLILAQPFTSLRLAASEVVRPARFLRFALPDIWQTQSTIRELRLPLLVVHSNGDKLFPYAMGQAIYGAAAVRPDFATELAIPSAHSHNAIYLSVPPDYWQPVVDFIRRHARRK